MPVLIMALIALVVFGVIGALLFAAAVLECRTESRHLARRKLATSSATKH